MDVHVLYLITVSSCLSTKTFSRLSGGGHEVASMRRPTAANVIFMGSFVLVLSLVHPIWRNRRTFFRSHTTSHPLEFLLLC